MGVRARFFDVDRGGARDVLASALSEGYRAVAASPDTLSSLTPTDYSIITRFDSALLYGFGPESRGNDLAAWLTDGGLGAVARTDRDHAEYSIRGGVDF